jgi:hypothetical protein
MKIVSSFFKNCFYSLIGDKSETYWITRNILVRALGFIYLCVFVPLAFQYVPLLGEKGLLPVQVFMARMHVNFPDLLTGLWKHPTLFWFADSDLFALSLVFLGIFLSIFCLFGCGSFVIFFILWVLQLSFYHVGQTFWSFGWESNLLELGFLAFFLCPLWKISSFPTNYPPSNVLMFLYRWVLFRLMFGAGLIKLRGDACWSDLSCLSYHYETQPIPNPLSPYFHFSFDLFHKTSIVFNHFAELIVPFFLFLPRPFRIAAGIIFLIFQISIMLTGNYAWINHLTIVMIIPCFDDKSLRKFFGFLKLEKYLRQSFHTIRTKKEKYLQRGIIFILFSFISYLSYQPIMNLIGPRQMMNYSYNQFHIVNSYGVFGSITKTRYELVIEGTHEKNLNEDTVWYEYELPCQPGDIYKRPCIMSPYHYRITWQIWFAAMGRLNHSPWLLHFVAKILDNNKESLRLLSKNPFLQKPPEFIRIRRYIYKFKNPWSFTQKAWYSREDVGIFLTPVNKDHPLVVRIKKFFNNP